MDNDERWRKVEEVVRSVIREELERFVEKHLRPELKEQMALFGKPTKIAFTNGKWTGVTDQQMEIWAAAYPSCDVPAELNRAAGWILSNPMKAPKTQLARFMNAWLARQQNASSIRSIPTRNEPRHETPKKCKFCDRRATGTIGSTPHCPDHTHQAMDAA